jgi:hypothetical protein
MRERVSVLVRLSSVVYVEASFDREVCNVDTSKLRRENGLWCTRKEVDDRVDEVNG